MQNVRSCLWQRCSLPDPPQSLQLNPKLSQPPVKHTCNISTDCTIEKEGQVLSPACQWREAAEHPLSCWFSPGSRSKLIQAALSAPYKGQSMFSHVSSGFLRFSQIFSGFLRFFQFFSDFFRFSRVSSCFLRLSHFFRFSQYLLSFLRFSLVFPPASFPCSPTPNTCATHFYRTLGCRVRPAIEKFFAAEAKIFGKVNGYWPSPIKYF